MRMEWETCREAYIKIDTNIRITECKNHTRSRYQCLRCSQCYSNWEQYLKIALLQNVWIGNNQGETCQMLQVALVATNNVFEFTEHLRDVVEQPLIIQCPAALQIIEAVYVWLGIRLGDFIAAGMEVSDLEMLRGFGIRFLDGAGFNEMQRQALISIMIKFKDLV